MMEFRGLPRRTLQSLCKKNGIPANLTNIAMADALHSLQTVEGVDETQEENQTPQKSPPQLRPPNPPRSCRRRSIISLIKEPNFSKKRRTFIVKDEDGGDIELQPICSLSSSPTASNRRRAERTLFPCDQKEILKSKVGGEEEMSGGRDERHVFDEMTVRRKSRYKNVGDIMKVCEGDCRLNEAVVAVSSPEESLGQGNGHREEGMKNEVFVYEEMPVRGKLCRNKNGTGRDCAGEAVLISTSPGTAEEMPGSRNAVFASKEMLGRGDGIEDQDDAEMVDDEKGEETTGEQFCSQSKPTLASQDHLKEAVLIPSSSEGVEEHCLKNRNFSSEEMLVRGVGRDCHLNEAGMMVGSPEEVEMQGFKNRGFVSEEGTGVENAELMEDEKEGEDTNGQKEEEGSKKEVFVYGEIPVRGTTSGDKNGPTQDCLSEATSLRPAEEKGSRNAVFASEEMLGTEDRDDVEIGDDEKGEETNGESYRRNNLTQASGDCQLNEAFRIPNYQESDSMVKTRELELLCGSGYNEQEQGSVDGLQQVLRGEVEGLGFAYGGVHARGATSEDKEGKETTIGRGERCEDTNDKVTTQYGEGEETNVESLTWKCGDCCQLNEAVLTPRSQESVEDQGLENAVFTSEEVHVRGETNEDEDAEMMEYKTEEEERTSSREIHIGTGNLESHGESFCKQGDCPSKAVEVLRDQQHGLSPDPSLGPLIPCGRSTNRLVEEVSRGKMEKQGLQEAGLQNVLIESCEMTARAKESEGMIDKKRSSEGLQVNVNVYTACNRIIPLDSKANQEQVSVVPDYEKAANSITSIPDIQNLHQKSPTTSETLDSNHGLDRSSSKSIVTSMFIEKEVANSSSPHVLQIGLQLSSNTLEPSDTPSTYEAKTGGQNFLSPQTGGTIFKEQEGTDLAKDNTEAKSIGGAKAEVNQSEKKAGLGSLSLRKLRSLYKENRKVSKLGMANKVKPETGGGETTMKDEVEEESAEKIRLNNLSLRKLKQMYKHKVST